MEERWNLIVERIGEIKADTQLEGTIGSYFGKVASFLLLLSETFENSEHTKEENEALYEDILGANYESSFANPSVCVKSFGKELGQMLSFVYAQMYGIIPAAFEKNQEELLIHMEWFVEIYCMFLDFTEEMKQVTEEAIGEAAQNSMEQRKKENLFQIIYWFVSDYYEEQMEKRVGEKVDPAFDFAFRIVRNSNLDNTDYLYQYGEYISANQIKSAEYLASLPQETIREMADTYTEGYRIGFIKGNKELSKKKVANIVYPIGFERVIRLAIDNFEKMGLQVTLMRTSFSIFHKRGTNVNGYYSTCPNKQFYYDHSEDDALFLDHKMMHRKLEVLTGAYEKFRELAKGHAGPAWMETFGEKQFLPADKEEACSYSKAQQKLASEYAVSSGKIINTYIPGEERSFTIIAFPVPEIGNDYAGIMTDTIKLNTLPYEQYERVQQVIIDALDTCKEVRVEGMNGNQTDLTIELCKLGSPEKETKFENCVADVNIPVGEVFTSPVLKGTNGVLQVSRVFLNDLEYQNLRITFKDGMVQEYSCSNYDKEEQNQKYIKDHVLHHFDTLPMGEFAIGTNTTAYCMGRKYGIEAKLPILIAEKTGPHFAVGDTCYSHAEDVAVFNPDGKEIIARDNEISLKRKSGDEAKDAYYQCHTDITIPYDELGGLYGLKEDGSSVEIIKNGRFVLAGCEMLNEAFEQ